MKHVKRVLAALLSTLMVVCLAQIPALSAHAEDPTVWTVTYNSTDGKWYAASPRLGYWTGADIINSNGRDGDHIVFDAVNNVLPIQEFSFAFNFGDVVATNGAFISLTCSSANKVYVAGTGSTLIVSAPQVNNLEVYPGQVIQVIGNVTNVLAHYGYDGTYPRFGVTGTVARANVNHNGNNESANTPIFGLAAGLCTSNDTGVVSLNASQYSLTPVASPVGSTPAAATQKPATGKTLDAVPKTGSNGVQESVVFFMLAAVFAIGALAMKKKLQ